jgi:hypothetical protein
VAVKHLAEAHEGRGRIEQLRATKSAILKAYAHGILYDGMKYFSPEMRHEIYAALGLKVTAHKMAGQERGGGYKSNTTWGPTPSDLPERYRTTLQRWKQTGRNTDLRFPGEKPILAWSS